MPGAVSRIEGMADCRRALQELSKTVQRNVGKRALKAGPGRVIAAAVKARAPVSARESDPTPGSLKESVKVVDSRTEKGRATIAVLADDAAAVPNEFGLSRRNYPAHPFFRPAVDAAREVAALAMAEEVKREVDAIVKRVAAKGAR